MNLNQRKDAEMQRREGFAGARPLGRFSVHAAGGVNNFEAPAIIESKRIEVRAPSRLCVSAPLR